MTSFETCKTTSDANCNDLWTTRFVWDGSQEIAEVMPSGSDADTGHVQLGLQNTTDRDAYFGRVLYTFGAEGTDHPLAITRIDYSDETISQGGGGGTGLTQPFLLYPPVGMATVWNSSGLVNPVTFQNCPLDSAGTALRCPQFVGQTDFYSGSRAQTWVVSWMGSLLQDKSNPDGTAYRRARVYDYETGRFTQEDPMGLGGGLNAYGFGAGDAINYDDPFGLCFEDACLAEAVVGLVWAVGQVIDFAVAVYAASAEANAAYHGYKAVAGSVGTWQARSGSMKPDPAAEGAHTTILRDGSTGKVKKYQEWQPNEPRDPRDPNKFKPGKRFDQRGGEHTNPDGSEVPTPHVHEPDGTARSPLPGETPK